MMSSIAVLPRFLGALFYYPPTSPDVLAIVGSLSALPALCPWAERAEMETLCQLWPEPEAEAFIWQYSVLFEGQGEMFAPPWASVYLEKENLLMGESTVRYRAFLRQHGLSFTGAQQEPEDQFGLMLLALAALLEQEKDQAAQTLLEAYLLPWSDRYLERVQQNPYSPFYAQLAAVTRLLLQGMQRHYGLQPETPRMFF